MRDGPFGPYMDYVPPGQSSGGNFHSFSRTFEPSGPSQSPMLSPPSTTSARFDPLPTHNISSTYTRGPDLFASSNPTWSSDSAFKWDFKPSCGIHRAGPPPRGGAIFKDEQFIPATMIINASTGPSYTISSGSEIRLKQEFLGKVESSVVSLRPGEISFEFDGNTFFGKLTQVPTGNYIIHGRDVDLNAIESSWKEITESPEGKTFAAGVKLSDSAALEVGGGFMGGKYVSGTVWINKDQLVQVQVGKTSWGEWFGNIKYSLGFS